MPTFWGEAVLVQTEIPYIAIAFGAFALLVGDKKGLPVVAGILLALANWIRPLALAYLLGMVVYLFIRRSPRRKYVFLLGSFLGTVMCIGAITYFHFGHFEYQSSTMGVNLIMGANDDANGNYNNICFEEGKIAYIHEETLQNMTYKEKNTFYTRLAVDWILKHPLQWVLLLPRKIFYLYGKAFSPFSYVFLPSDSRDEYPPLFLSSTEASQQRNVMDRFIDQWSRGELKLDSYLLIYGQLIYMGLVFGFLCGCIRLLKKKNYVSLLPLFTTFFIGSAMTIITVGISRYQVPYLPIFMVFTAFMLSDVRRRTIPDNSPPQ
jgi:hypothetical protein